jgi:hypothetical protein
MQNHNTDLPKDDKRRDSGIDWPIDDELCKVEGVLVADDAALECGVCLRLQEDDAVMIGGGGVRSRTGMGVELLTTGTLCLPALSDTLCTHCLSATFNFPCSNSIANMSRSDCSNSFSSASSKIILFTNVGSFVLTLCWTWSFQPSFSGDLNIPRS